MNTLHLKRISQNEECTYGTFVYENHPISVSLELPWKNNEHDISCIPSGSYPCKLIGKTTKFPYEHYAIDNVPNRKDVLIHRGNFTHDTKGCILAGRQFGPGGVILSQIALDDMIKVLPKEFTLIITESL